MGGSPEEKARAVFTARAATYTTSASHVDPEVLARLVRRAEPVADWDALDVATGTGHTAFALAPHVRHVVGTDLTPRMLEEAERLRAMRGIDNVTFRVADVHELPFASESFQLVTARRAPHHFSDIRRALAEMRRVLAPGGRLVIDDRSVPEDDEVDALLNHLDRLHDPSHIRQYRPAQWCTLLGEVGFRVESVEPYTRLRPASDLRRDAAPEDATEIDRVLSALTPRQREILQVEAREGELHHLHFFVMLAATK